ncbi:outer membrane protein OmpK [Pseudomonas sp. NBRC 111123]|uniref:outer membrane protein OmpK n=1 Tax=Pseudomonas sp. NBRC 111123 TaxID=1661038 RepID=UPI0007619702|nr:outer membrane protein OmpK [Pseudomonas sp. NBRC 111123]
MERTLACLLIASGLLAAGQALAGGKDLAPGPVVNDGPLLWHNESLTYLWGKNYKVDPPIQQTFTFESASNWTWGDIWFFVDQINYNGKDSANNGKSSYYGEFSPRLSLGKITGSDLSFGPIKDVLIASTYEFGEGDVEAYLLGPAVDLAIPGFDYFQLNVYYRKPDGNRVPSGAWQVTPAWAITIPVGNSDILFDGFMDWVVNNKDASASHRNQSDYHANLHFNPQLKYDLGKAMGYEAKHLYVGLEYDYWSDKYGIRDSKGFTTDQNTASALVKYHF